MRALLDTNIVLRYLHKDSESHAEVARAVHSLTTGNNEAVLVPQVLYEYWAVATRPYGSSNGLSLTTEEAAHTVRLITTRFLCLPDPPELFGTWLDLVTTHQVSGRPTHDARLAAAVRVHQLDAFLTLNAPDFKRFGLNVVSPADVTENP